MESIWRWLARKALQVVASDRAALAPCWPDRWHAASALGLVLNIIMNDGGLVNQFHRSSGVHEGFDVLGVQGCSKKQLERVRLPGLDKWCRAA